MIEKKVARAKHKNVNKQESINWELVNSALQAGCSGVEIAAKLGMNDETLTKACRKKFGVMFSEYALAQKQNGDLLLKMKMFQIAMNGDRGMLMFLAKTRLGMVEEHKIEITAIPQIAWSTDITPILEIESSPKKLIEENAVKNDNTDKETGVSGLLLEP